VLFPFCAAACRAGTLARGKPGDYLGFMDASHCPAVQRLACDGGAIVAADVRQGVEHRRGLRGDLAAEISIVAAGHVVGIHAVVCCWKKNSLRLGQEPQGGERPQLGLGRRTGVCAAALLKRVRSLPDVTPARRRAIPAPGRSGPLLPPQRATLRACVTRGSSRTNPAHVIQDDEMEATRRVERRSVRLMRPDGPRV
jgi:hypothetical protein